MTTFVVTRKADGAEITRYAAAAPVEQVNDLAVPFADFDHTEFTDTPVEPSPPPIHTWTKLRFERKFSDEEWQAGQNFNATFETSDYLTDAQKLTIRRGLNDYKIALDITSTDPGVINLLGLYEAFGVLAPGRAQEILNGR